MLAHWESRIKKRTQKSGYVLVLLIRSQVAKERWSATFRYPRAAYRINSLWLFGVARWYLAIEKVIESGKYHPRWFNCWESLPSDDFLHCSLSSCRAWSTFLSYPSSPIRKYLQFVKIENLNSSCEASVPLTPKGFFAERPFSNSCRELLDWKKSSPHVWNDTGPSTKDGFRATQPLSPTFPSSPFCLSRTYAWHR